MQNLSERPQKFKALLVIAGMCIVTGCAGPSRYVQHKRPSYIPPQEKPQSSATPSEKKPEPEVIRQEKKKDQGEGALDFAFAFVDSGKEQNTEPPALKPSEQQAQFKAVVHYPFTVPRTGVRVALVKSVSRAVVYSLETADIGDGRRGGTGSCRGRIAIRCLNLHGRRPRAELQTKEGLTGVFLPCTLHARSAFNYVEMDAVSYRGSLIIVPEKNDKFTVVNYCPVEDYLRGVVPLEIGKRPEADIEAVKAQAVAARTYTYRKMIERDREPYDLAATVEDQVYGGVNAEDRLSDRAIMLTKDHVLVYGDSLISAFYHSTCGGKTADIENVWNRTAEPCLKSVSDIGPDGKPWCAISRYCTWSETWNTQALSSILRRFSGSAFPSQPQFTGDLRKIVVEEYFPCGRISRCEVFSTTGTFTFRGDKIRFAFRRNQQGYPILRSANFTVSSCDGKQVVFQGHGYGHGVGMCQMGALGRARAGQLFDTILLAYYTDAALATVRIPGTDR